jgi:hypothetical protein
MRSFFASRFCPAALGAAVFASLAMATPQGASAMQFATVPVGETCSPQNCPRALIAEGEINDDAPARFARFLRQELATPGLHAVVFLNSPGGNVESSLRLGAMIHEAGAAIVIGRPVPLAARSGSKKRMNVGSVGVVPGHCASACVYTLMGAKKRVVPVGARLGVHRMSARAFALDPAGGGTHTGRIYAGSPEIAALRAYVARVGGSQDLISLAESIPHDQIRMLSGAEVRKFRLGTPSL